MYKIKNEKINLKFHGKQMHLDRAHIQFLSYDLRIVSKSLGALFNIVLLFYFRKLNIVKIKKKNTRI